jgi:tellurite methyltransferase
VVKTCNTRLVIRQIVGFHEDSLGDWVAELSCFHARHVRHRPPFDLRPWVVTSSGRASRVGSTLECVYCDRRELPDGLIVTRIAGPFDDATLPPALLSNHRIAAGCWGRLRVLEGAVTFRAIAGPFEVHLERGSEQPIPPDDEHCIVMHEARIEIDFLRPAPSRASEAVLASGP